LPQIGSLFFDFNFDAQISMSLSALPLTIINFVGSIIVYVHIINEYLETRILSQDMFV